MNKHILTLATVLTLIFFGGGCDYNDDNFEGLQDGTVATDVKRFDYTLTDEDYTAIANNKTNKSIASDAGASAALKAIGTNKYFATKDDAAAYIPAYLSANYPTLDNTSTAMVTYTCALDLPENVVAMNAMKEIKKLDYTKVWGEGSEIEYLTPATESKLTDALPTDGLEAGDYVAVTYQYAGTEPVISDPEPAKPEFTSVLGTAALDAAVEVTGYISALSSQGPILTDNGGSILLYGNKATSHLKLGEVVKVSGTIGHYNNGFQIAADKATITQTGQSETVSYPTPRELDGAAMDAILTNRTDKDYYAEFVKVKGTVSIDGKYYNFDVAGATTATGSFYGITDAIKEKIENGKEATLYGYLSSVSKSKGAPKFVNIIVTHVNETPAVNPSTPDPANPELTSVLGTAALEAAVEVTGYISALSSQGPILTDNGGSVLLYGNKATSHLKLGEVVKVSGTIGHYNNGFQIAADKATINSTNQTITVTYPTPRELDGAAMDAILTNRTDKDYYAEFVKVKGTVSIDGKYCNFNVAGATTATGSFYGITDAIKEKIENGKEATLYGYLSSVSKSSGAPKFVNIIVTHVNETPATVKTATLALNTRADVATEKRYAVYTWDGSNFTATENAVLQPSDYTAMGQKYGNFTDPDQDVYLPQYLTANFPYGKADDVKYVSYLRYKDKKTSWATDEYVFDGMKWAKRSYFETREDQFVKSKNKWSFDPSVVWVIEAGKNMHPATEFFQACVDWVKANVQNGSSYISSYGNNDYYSGASAYQGNLDWRPTSALGQYADGYKGMSNEEILKAMQDHTVEVFTAVLPQFYPDLAPIDGIDVTLTVQCGVYTGTTTYYNFVFKVVGAAKYEFQSFAPVE